MLKGERGFFALVVLCLLLAGVVWTAMRPPFPQLPTEQNKEADEGKYSPGSPACYPSRLESLPKREGADERYRCETQAEKHRLQSNDLVQQTRSADAATASVSLTYRQMLIELAGAIFGVLTLLAAGYAAWYARRAAEAGHTANGLAADALEGQLRPWIDFSVLNHGTIEIVDGNLEITGEATFKNLGASPAIDLTYMPTMIFGDEITDHFKQLAENFDTNEIDWADQNLFPGSEWSRKVCAIHVDELPSQPIKITFVLIARYRTLFSDKYRFTAKAYEVHGAIQTNSGDFVPQSPLLAVGQYPFAYTSVILHPKQHFAGIAS